MEKIIGNNDRARTDYLYGERVYVILSFVAKTILAWLVFVGVFAPF